MGPWTWCYGCQRYISSTRGFKEGRCGQCVQEAERFAGLTEAQRAMRKKFAADHKECPRSDFDRAWELWKAETGTDHQPY
jgi:hypothetical protein